MDFELTPGISILVGIRLPLSKTLRMTLPAPPYHWQTQDRARPGQWNGTAFFLLKGYWKTR